MNPSQDPHELEELLESYRNETEATPHQTDALRRRVTQTLKLASQGAHTQSPLQTASAWSAKKVLLSALLFSAGFASGAAVILLRSPKAPQPLRSEQATTKPEPKIDEGAAPTQPPPHETIGIKHARTSGANSAQKPAPQEHAAAQTEEDFTLTQERFLIDSARAQLKSRNIAGALALIETHRRFQNARMAEERDALYVRLLVASNRRDEALAQFEEFQQKYPNSLFTGGISAAFAAQDNEKEK